jgi:hypothetical protein
MGFLTDIGVPLFIFTLSYILIHKYGKDKDNNEKKLKIINSLISAIMKTDMLYTMALNPETDDIKELIEQKARVELELGRLTSYFISFYSNRVYFEVFEVPLAKLQKTLNAGINHIEERKMTEEKYNLLKNGFMRDRLEIILKIKSTHFSSIKDWLRISYKTPEYKDSEWFSYE